MLITNNLIEVLIPMKPKANYKWLIGCSFIKKLFHERGNMKLCNHSTLLLAWEVLIKYRGLLLYPVVYYLLQ